MSKKQYNLIYGIVTGLESIAVASVAYMQPPTYPAICAAIPIVTNAVLAVCKLFVTD